MSELAIETSGLVRRFGSHTAVDHIDLRVPGGSIYGFLGPNGAGKSTTIRLLLGLLAPDAGSVRLFGQPLRERRQALLKRTGALIEAPPVYEHLTGRENVEVTRRLRGVETKHTDRVLEAVELAGGAAGRRVGAYSMGMKQRLGLALALLGEPDLLVLDEPTSGLDPAGIQDVRALIRQLPERTGATVFLSSHLLGEVERTATHVGVLREGHLVFQGETGVLAGQKERRVTIGTQRPGEAARLLRASGIKTREGGPNGRLAVPLEEGKQAHRAAARYAALLVQNGFDVYHVTAEESSLEDLFMRLTRHEKEPAPAE